MHVFSNKFHYTPANNSFVGDASDICKVNDRMFHWLPCNELGLVLISDKTKSEAEFVCCYRNKDNDGIITSWILKPTICTVNKYPKLKNSYIRIFND